MGDNRNGDGRGRTYALIGVPFVIASLALLCLGVVPTLHDWQRMKSWTMVEARLDEARLRNHSDTEGDDVYKVGARYRYVVEGREYTGARVAISGMADNVGDFQLALGSELEAALRLDRPIHVWVNPRRPAEAVIDRSLRPGLFAGQLFFMLATGGIGGTMLYLLWRPPRRHAAAAGVPAAAPKVRPPSDPAAAARALAGAVRREPIPGGMRLVVPFGSQPHAQLPRLVAGLGTIALGTFLNALDAPLPFPLLFGGIGALLVAQGMWRLLGGRHVELDRQYGLRSERRLLGIAVARERIPAREIRALTASVVAWRSAGGSSAPVAYRIELRTRGDRRVTLVDRVPDRGAAEQLLREIGTSAGLALELG